MTTPIKWIRIQITAFKVAFDIAASRAERGAGFRDSIDGVADLASGEARRRSKGSDSQ